MTTELKELEKVERIYEGEQIKGLFSRPQSVNIVIDNKKYGKIKFVIKPMNNDIYAAMGNAMKSSGIDLEKVKQLDGLKVFAEVYYPAMKVVFPYCCITPKIIDGISSDPKDLIISDVPMDVLMELFNEIMSASGLSEAEVENRKN